MRAYQVFTLRPPLLGQVSSSSIGTGHTLYDPGPLQYWLLALPVHVDPSQGALWGAALCCGLVLSLAVEALWSTGRAVGCALVGFLALDLALLVPGLFAYPTSNPIFAVPFVLTSVVLAWLVATGSFGWWPWLVVTASVAVQSEVFFAYFAVAMVLVSPCMGLLRLRPKRKTWLVLGLILGSICWFPPFLQQVFGKPGNLALLFDAHRAHPSGVAFGLRALGLAGSPHPIWTLGDLSIDHSLGGGGVLPGVAILLAMAGLTVVAWGTKRFDLAALAGLGLICSVCTVVTFASIPTSLQPRVIYLDRVLWIVGALLWTAAVWGLIEWGRSVLRYRPTSVRPEAAAPLWTCLAVVTVLTVGVVGTFAVRHLADSGDRQINSRQIRLVREATTGVEQQTPKGPVNIIVLLNVSGFDLYSLGQGVAWQLTADGWRPQLDASFTAVSGIPYHRSTRWPDVTVSFKGSKPSVHRYICLICQLKKLGRDRRGPGR